MGAGVRTCFLSPEAGQLETGIPQWSPGTSDPRARHCPHAGPHSHSKYHPPNTHTEGYSTLCRAPHHAKHLFLSQHPKLTGQREPGPDPGLETRGVDKDRQRGCKGAKNRGFWREEPGPGTHQQPLEGRVELPDFVGQPL